MKIQNLKISALKEKLKSGETSCEEFVASTLERAKILNKRLNNFITINDGALEEAKKTGLELKRGSRKKLSGIPVAIKDNIITRDIKTTCGSKILSNFIPPYDSTAVRKLKEEGAIIIGKTNMDEFAMGSSNEHSFYGPAKNPWNPENVTGGSSGGSASVVSTLKACAALGSDTGGSVRQPASFCGVVGLKPTYGRVSRYGLVAFASSLDQIGILADNVYDCALLSEVIFGSDEKDSTSANLPVPAFTEDIKNKPRGLKIGYVREHFGDGLDKDVKDSALSALKHLEGMGHSIEEISMPNSEYAIATYYIIATAEASSNLARYDGVRYGFRAKDFLNLEDMYTKTRTQGFGEEVKRRIMLGTFVLSSGYYDAYYEKAQRVRTLIMEDYKRAFNKVDAIISPTSPTPAFKAGEKLDDPLQMYLSDVYTTSVNLAGLPGISVPCGFSKNDLPIGMQIIGKQFDESTILKLAHHYEQTTQWKERHPKI